MKKLFLLFAAIAMFFPACGNNKPSQVNNNASDAVIASAVSTVETVKTAQSPFEGSWCQVLQCTDFDDYQPLDYCRYGIDINSDTIRFDQACPNDLGMLYSGLFEPASDGEIDNLRINDTINRQYFKATVSQFSKEDVKETIYFSLFIDQCGLLHGQWLKKGASANEELVGKEIVYYNTKAFNQKWPSTVGAQLEWLEKIGAEEYPEITEDRIFREVASFCDMEDLVAYTNNDMDEDDYEITYAEFESKPWNEEWYGIKIKNMDRNILTELRMMPHDISVPDEPEHKVLLVGVLQKNYSDDEEIRYQKLCWYEYDSWDMTVQRVDIKLPGSPNPDNTPLEYSFNDNDLGMTVRVIGGDTYNYMWNEKDFELKK